MRLYIQQTIAPVPLSSVKVHVASYRADRLLDDSAGVACVVRTLGQESRAVAAIEALAKSGEVIVFGDAFAYDKDTWTLSALPRSPSAASGLSHQKPAYSSPAAAEAEAGAGRVGSLSWGTSAN